MGQDLERLKQRLPLLEYLQRHNWTAHRAGARQEFLGLPSAKVSRIWSRNWRRLPRPSCWSTRPPSISFSSTVIRKQCAIWSAGDCMIPPSSRNSGLAMLPAGTYVVISLPWAIRSMCCSNQAGQQASHRLARRLKSAGIRAHMVQLPQGHDPNRYFGAGATAADFTVCLQRAHPL